MEITFLIGRILFGGFFVYNGLNHFLKNKSLTEYAEAKGIKKARILVYLSGLLIILGGVGIILGAYINLSLLFISLFLIIVSFKMHAFWKIHDTKERQLEYITFTKNMALLGATLMMYSILAPWDLALNLKFY